MSHYYRSAPAPKQRTYRSVETQTLGDYDLPWYIESYHYDMDRALEAFSTQILCLSCYSDVPLAFSQESLIAVYCPWGGERVVKEKQRRRIYACTDLDCLQRYYAKELKEAYYVKDVVLNRHGNPRKPLTRAQVMKTRRWTKKEQSDPIPTSSQASTECTETSTVGIVSKDSIDGSPSHNADICGEVIAGLRLELERWKLESDRRDGLYHKLQLENAQLKKVIEKITEESKNEFDKISNEKKTLLKLADSVGNGMSWLEDLKKRYNNTTVIVPELRCRSCGVRYLIQDPEVVVLGCRCPVPRSPN
ncbi:hypothetical protein BJ508DRAFT_309103 [Ascobolus immersus RN42]|uniref:Uncharacterized protein n=1 Tax=Ascobolus immersus RN42 TaxID=1160509 RepID=A0A3N4HXQ7_ASCIM|nr:hypothetical protein BJ508DRAFT_309103 [Ascobolus immersus RN42]